MIFDINKSSNQLAVFLVLLGCGIILANIFSIPLMFLFSEDSVMLNRLISCLSQIFVFFMPSFILAWWLQKKGIYNYLKIKTLCSWKTILLVLLISLASIPMMSAIIKWNESITFPSALHALEQWMQNMEAELEQLTEAMLNVKTLNLLIINIFAIAFLPALCEEVAFRGFLLHWLNNVLKNKHLAVWLSAILFSFIHFQFYGFVPRMLLGVFMAYLVIYSGSLWTSIIAHFFNNLLAVVSAFAYYNGFIQTHYDDIGSLGGAWYVIVISIVLTSLLLFAFFRKYGKDSKNKQTLS